MCNVLLLGTSRLHRPFAKRVDRRGVFNIQDGMEISFAKMGYFHTAAEALQIIRFIRKPECLPPALRKYIFRVEPRATTPLNEFDPNFEASIRAGISWQSGISLQDIDCLVMEVSSLSVNLHVPSGCVFHANPNFTHNVPYGDLYPAGYYKKIEPDLPVDRIETVGEMLTTQLREIRSLCPHMQVIVMGHLRSPKHPNVGRDRIHMLLQEASCESGCMYFDTAPFLDQYGFAKTNGTIDIHHLSDEGECEIGKSIQLTAQTLE